jgi:hypothetical protein
MHNTNNCRKYEKDGSEKANFHATKKGGKKDNSAKQTFAQLSKKSEMLEKAIKEQSAQWKKRCRNDSNSNIDK